MKKMNIWVDIFLAMCAGTSIGFLLGSIGDPLTSKNTVLILAAIVVAIISICIMAKRRKLIAEGKLKFPDGF